MKDPSHILRKEVCVTGVQTPYARCALKPSLVSRGGTPGFIHQKHTSDVNTLVQTYLHLVKSKGCDQLRKHPKPYVLPEHTCQYLCNESSSVHVQISVVRCSALSVMCTYCLNAHSSLLSSNQRIHLHVPLEYDLVICLEHSINMTIHCVRHAAQL